MSRLSILWVVSLIFVFSGGLLIDLTSLAVTGACLSAIGVLGVALSPLVDAVLVDA